MAGLDSNRPTRDIRVVKKELRQKFTDLRASVNLVDKVVFDGQILDRLTSLPTYQNASLILTYVSMGSEVDTHKLIIHALHEGKAVGVPRCTDEKGHMDFYYIRSLNNLQKSTFGLSEPDPQKCEKITDFSNSICILPALAFDKLGYRLGYGKGYYDRFLAKYKGARIGFCYSRCLTDALPHSKYDVPVDSVITPKNIRYYKKH